MEKIYALVAKTEKLNYAMVLALWAVGGALTLVGFPWIVLGILAMHIPETFFIGIPTGKENGDGLLNSIALTMTYGFFWWMPVKHKLLQEKK
ncbi:MAG: hypothetical protein J6T14_02965 [Clostridia bacterium]|nr:hypothetical protein [Clostridia bacterium]MBP5271922.1 hypothetical protein [Clostridia bacterium]